MTDFAAEFIQRRGNSHGAVVSSWTTNQRGTTEGETTTATGGHQRRGEPSHRTLEEIKFYAQDQEGATHEALRFPWNRRGTRSLPITFNVEKMGKKPYTSRCFRSIEIFEWRKVPGATYEIFPVKYSTLFLSYFRFFSRGSTTSTAFTCFRKLMCSAAVDTPAFNVAKDRIAGVTSFNDINWSTWMDLRNAQ